MPSTPGEYKELAMSEETSNDKKGENNISAGTTRHMGEIIKESVLKYKVQDIPPIPVTFMSALQHILLSISGCLTTSSVVADVACVPYDHPVRSQLFCTTMFMVGLCTLTQTGLGVRLPIFQGPSSSFLVPLLALQRDPSWTCSNIYTEDGILQTNVTMATNESITGNPDVLPGIRWRLQQVLLADFIFINIELI
ncbi:hypothetical protein Btru_076592 [Bulinus truncatus]|nr:hypothetical protein Btru_076592 [Bulinus truncatus]